MRQLLIILLFVLTAPAFATRYYVKNGGNNALDGLADATAWETISKVNGFTFAAGDTISFKCGSTWREALVVPRSGTSADYMVFNSYGIGDKPKLLGSNTTTWADMGGNIWKSESTFSVNPYTASFYSEIFFNASGTITWGLHKADTASLTAEYQWTWALNYVYVYAVTDPDTRYTTVEVPQRDYVVNIGNTNEYICLDSLDIRYAKAINIDDRDPETSLSGFRLKNSHVAYVGERYAHSSGYNVAVCRNHLLIQNNEIHDGGRRAISIHLYDASNISFTDFIIEGNYLHDNYHATAYGIAMDGPRSGNEFSNIIIRYNKISDDPSRNAPVDGWDVTTQGHMEMSESGGKIHGVQIYGNLWYYSTFCALELVHIDTVDIFNNTFYDLNHNANGLGYAVQLWLHAGTEIKVKNNIFYCDAPRTPVFPNSIFIESGSTAEYDVDYNLFFATTADIGLINNAVSGKTYRMPGGSMNYSWAIMKTDLGWQSHEPGLVDPTFINAPDSLQLSVGSPAIGAGVGVGLNTDYSGNAVNSPPDIGAYAYNSTPPDPPGLPEVTTGTATYTAITANVSYEITSNGGGTLTNRGVCWSTTANPTISNNKTIYTASLGSFTDVLRGLSGGTTYHVRAYVTNESGTAYGADVLITTLVSSQGMTNGLVGKTNGLIGVNK